jgi:pimeloyl-ACP methyl ester carboxylesterase
VTGQRKVELSTGITMNVAIAGPDDAPPVILMHGFPESHRTWREVAPLLSDELRLIMPDLRGFGESDRPQDVASYATDTLIADIFALADALEIDRFALVGHDWGGAIAWAAALRGNPRVDRLAIVHRIVTDYGGSIDVRPRSGGGTVFRITFPLPAESGVTARQAS